jgi:hypothetical protein
LNAGRPVWRDESTQELRKCRLAFWLLLSNLFIKKPKLARYLLMYGYGQ